MAAPGSHVMAAGLLAAAAAVQALPATAGDQAPVQRTAADIECPDKKDEKRARRTLAEDKVPLLHEQRTQAGEVARTVGAKSKKEQ